MIWQLEHHENSQKRSTENRAVDADAEILSGNAAGGEGEKGKEEWVFVENMLSMSAVLKRNYAAKDRAFVILIRSGVEWWRKSFVACW